MSILIKWFITSIAVMISAYLIPGVTIEGLFAALVASVILGLINITIKPILLIFTLPINILTLGLFTFIINAGMILLAAKIVEGFSVSGFFVALIFSIVLSIVSYILNVVFKSK